MEVNASEWKCNDVRASAVARECMHVNVRWGN
jgi:hypothetical protein